MKGYLSDFAWAAFWSVFAVSCTYHEIESKRLDFEKCKYLIEHSEGGVGKAGIRDCAK